MKKIIKIISTLVLLSVIILPITNVFAYSEYKVGEKVELGKYTGTIIDEKNIPDGIQPVKIDDLESVEVFVNKFDNNLFSNNKINVSVNSDFETKASTGSQTKRMSAVSGLYVKAYYTYVTNPVRFGRCTNVTSYLSGQPFADWTQTSYRGNVIESGRTLAISFSGLLDLYIVTPIGLVKVETSSHDLYTEFYYTAI